MNLKDAKGRVPIYTGSDTTPYILVAFPSREAFPKLYRYKMTAEQADRDWNLLRRRAAGASLLEAGQPFDLSKEGVRKIEAKFMRMMRECWLKETSSGTGLPQSPRPADESR